MERNSEERAQTARLEESYSRLQSDLFLSIERQVCGCDYGGSSWTTRNEAQCMETKLGLKPGMHLLEVGAGSGWPGIYFADRSGCDLAMIDLPLAGLKIAAERAERDRIAGTYSVACADATNLPFGDASFDALSHSDLLCCLKQKRAVLASCNRVTSREGRMVFTVISIAANISAEERIRALAGAPEFTESEVDYLTLLDQTGWTVLESLDLSSALADSCRRQAREDIEHKGELEALIGASDYADRQKNWASKLSALEDGLVRRELFVVTPA